MARDDESPNPIDVARLMSNAVSLQGHGFHYAVMSRAEELAANRDLNWVFDAAEFPVAVASTVTHVDFTMRARRGSTRLVAECKRADPKKARWCFLRTPYTWYSAEGDELVFESVEYRPANIAIAQSHLRRTTRGVYNLAFDLRTQAPGDGIGGRPSVMDAAAQVLRSVNGLINHDFGEQRGLIRSAGKVFFLPVIFTTAELWTSPADLRAADLQTGRMDVGSVAKADWIWFNYNQSPALLHTVERREEPGDLPEALRRQFCRSIAIVSSEAVDQFLLADMNELVAVG